MDSDQTEIQNARRMKNLQQQVRNEAERLSEQGAAPDNDANIGEDPALSPVKRDFDDENLGNMNEEQPFDPGYDFENQNNMY